MMLLILVCCVAASGIEFQNWRETIAAFRAQGAQRTSSVPQNIAAKIDAFVAEHELKRRFDELKQASTTDPRTALTELVAESVQKIQVAVLQHLRDTTDKVGGAVDSVSNQVARATAKLVDLEQFVRMVTIVCVCAGGFVFVLCLITLSYASKKVAVSHEKWARVIKVPAKKACESCSATRSLVAFVPCSHVVVCTVCAAKLNQCPTCTSSFRTTIELRFVDE